MDNPESHVTDIQDIAFYVENNRRLNAAVERMRRERAELRLERDNLQRDYDFEKLEHKFKVEALEAQLARATPIPHGNSDSRTQTLRRKRVEHGTLVSVLVSQYLLSQCEFYQSQTQTLSDSLEDARRNSMVIDGLEEEARGRIVELEEDNTSLAESLQASSSQITELTSRIAVLEEELSSERVSHQATGVALAEAEQQISELSTSIDNTVSERDSLSLQISHVTQDLETTRGQLEDIEERYSKLQTQQLSSMSSSQVNRALRDKIEDLEYKVGHRTEQLGIHQHELKRLETNLRLQEDRIAEMTVDMEVLQSEKDAMIEDCNMTRDERDEARRRCEELEERIEALEEGTSQAETQRDAEMHTVLGLLFQERTARRSLSRRLVSSWSTYADRRLQMQARIREVEASEAHALETVEQLSQDRKQTAQLLDEKVAEWRDLRNERDSALARIHETTSALEAAQAELVAAKASLDEVRDHGSSAEGELAHVQTQLREKTTELSDLRTLYEALCTRFDDTKTSFTAEVADLESQIRSLQDTNADLESRRAHAQEELTRISQELQSYRSNGSESALVQERLRMELEEARASHAEEMGSLRAEIMQARVDLEEAKQHQLDLESMHKLALDALTHTRDDLKAQLAEVTEKLQSSDGTQTELIELQGRYSIETKDLQDRLDRVSLQLDAAQRELEARDADAQKTARRLEEQLSTASDVLHAKEDLEMELTQLRAQHEAEVRSLERRISDLTNEEAVVKRSQADLETRCHDLAQEKSDLENKLSQMTSDIDQLQDQLRVLLEKYELAVSQHSQELKASSEREEESQSARDHVLAEMADLRAQFEETERTVNMLQDEKQDMQTDMTQLEAEVQRLLSLHRYQESHANDSERHIVSLREQLEQAQAAYVEIEKAAKAAEISMELQTIQHEKTLSSLRREVNSLRANSKLEETVAELTERNNEMEQLLQAKCLEIEENDDRMMEVLKEKKKLISKVENLTKKVNALQAKLSAAPSSTDTTPAQAPRLSGPRTISPQVPVIPPAASSSRTPPAPSTPNSRRAASGSSLSRPKTPETRVPPPPVFKARTPESKRVPQSIQQHYQSPPPLIITSSSSSSSLGKKRRAPDDFEDCESLPPQGFTVESVPSPETENMQTTPRVRRALQAVRTGFTPVRSHPAQATHTVLASPARRATTGPSQLIADVTNSPRGASMAAAVADAKAGKRSWLGKIRGGPGIAAGRSVSSRAPSAYDRQPSGGSSR
ncbi:hypothetical protein BXZ70DRAFT_217302 [Cristinia sonorae]|uniref:Uncharacterized protein n=1 Tax=Cristinia sonorae TaxID=1940300 RepID=A0A8K0ULJ2_9AGAR|nr:hypothetical protein BXZ70DRAFT_217302 [Cristinia sonorae]